MRFIAFAAAVVLMAACSRAAASPQPSSARLPTSTVASSAQTASAPPPATTASGAAVGDYLPSELDGVELHTFPVGQEVTARLGEAAGTELELAYASEHGTRFIQTIAIRTPGADADSLHHLFPAAAFPPDGVAVEITPMELGGEQVTAVADPAALARLGTYYLLVRDDVLIVIEAFRPEDAADMIGALPQP